MPAAQLVVDGAEAHEPAHAALLRRVDAVEPHLFRRPVRPRGVGVEPEIEIRQRHPHAILQRFAGVLHVVEHRPVPFRRDHAPEETAEQPHERAVLVERVALDGNAIEHREADARAKLLAHAMHRLGARRQRTLIGLEEQRRQRGAVQLRHDAIQLGEAGPRERHDPVARADLVSLPGARRADVVGQQRRG